jgi:hypothetical protein
VQLFWLVSCPLPSATKMCRCPACCLRSLGRRWAKLLLLEADEGVLQHVQALKDWPLELLSAEGWVLLDMEASRAGKYHDMRQVGEMARLYSGGQVCLALQCICRACGHVRCPPNAVESHLLASMRAGRRNTALWQHITYGPCPCVHRHVHLLCHWQLCFGARCWAGLGGCCMSWRVCRCWMLLIYFASIKGPSQASVLLSVAYHCRSNSASKMGRSCPGRRLGKLT